jgi:hypothetical protein
VTPSSTAPEEAVFADVLERPAQQVVALRSFDEDRVPVTAAGEHDVGAADRPKESHSPKVRDWVVESDGGSAADLPAGGCVEDDVLDAAAVENPVEEPDAVRAPGGFVARPEVDLQISRADELTEQREFRGERQLWPVSP